MKPFYVRGEILGDDDTYVAGAKYFRFEINPETLSKLKAMRHLLYASDTEYAIDLYSVTSLDLFMMPLITNAPRGKSACPHLECLELVVAKDVFYWQFTLGESCQRFQTQETEFAGASGVLERTKGWEG